MNHLKRWISLLLCTVLSVTSAEGLFAAEEGSDPVATVESIASFDGNGESILVVGSDGSRHEGVDYLNVDAVRQFNEAQQENYTWLCDQAAEIAADGIEWSSIDIVVNSDQIPELQWSLPIRQVFDLAPSAEIIPFEGTANALDVTSSEEISVFNASFNRDSYFRDQLTETQKVYYDASIAAAKKQKPKFTSETETESYTDAFIAFGAAYFAAPQYYEWVDLGAGSFASLSKADDHSIFVGMKAPKSKHYSKSLETKAKKKIKSLVKKAEKYADKNYSDDPEYGIVKYLDNWICKNNYYKNKGASDKKKDMRSAAYYYSHSSYGCLLKGYGVCESYARAMSRLLDYAGITNVFVAGDATSNPSDEPGGHAWNQVMLNGSWYLEDATWNCDTKKGKKKKSNQDYFLIGSSDEAEYGSTHSAVGEFFYGEEYYLSFPSLASTGYGLAEQKEEWYYQPAA